MTRWLLLRGLARESRHWGDFPQALRLRSGDEVVCFDLPGNGLRNGERSPDTIEAMADLCHRELGGGKDRWRLVAMSLGAMVAVAWATRHPADMSAAALINTSLRPFSRFYERLRPGNYLRVIALAAMPQGDREVESAVLDLTSHLAAKSPQRVQLIEEWSRWRRLNPVSRANFFRQLSAAARYRAPEQAPAVPLQILVSRQDALVSANCSARLGDAWGIPVEWHDGAGHDLPLDDPEWVIGRLLLAKGAPAVPGRPRY